MRLVACSKEKAVWRAVWTGNWAPGLREHAANCSACREVALVTRGVSSLARNSSDEGALPDPRQTWWRAEWLRTNAAERAIRPIILYRRVAAGGVLLVLALVGTLAWPFFLQWMPAWEGSWRVFGLTLPLVTVPALACIGCLLAYHTLTRED